MQTALECIPYFARQTLEPARVVTHTADIHGRLARDVLRTADQIVFDRLLIEQLPGGRTTVGVRGSRVLNDAPLEDARTAELLNVAKVLDNGSDLPGTVPSDCSGFFAHRFAEADLVPARGQGNVGTLSIRTDTVILLSKVKSPCRLGTSRCPPQCIW